MKKKFDLFALFENKRFLTVFAVLMAILLYIMVAMNKDETTEWTIPNMPVNLDLQAANLSNLRLNIIEGGEHYVDVKIKVPRTQIGQYNAESPELATTARISSITEPGTYTLPVTSAYSETGDSPISIVSYSPSTVEVRVDRLKSTSFDIRAIIKGLSVSPGYVTGTETISPSTVNVSGPEAEVAKIQSAEISLDLTEPLERTYAWSLTIVLKDAAGQEIDPSEHYIKMDVTEAQLAIPVLKQTGVPLEVAFQNQPRDFPIEELEELMTITPDYVSIAGREEVVERLTEIRAGYVDLTKLQPGNSSFTFPLRLGEISDEIISLDNVTSVSVSFDEFDWDVQSFNLKNIQIINEPANYSVETLADRLDNVQLVGNKEVLESLTADDIVAEVDLFDRELSSGQRSYPVKVSVPGKGLVWALGSYSTYIQITENEQN